MLRLQILTTDSEYPIYSNVSLGQTIRALRERRKLDQASLAQRLGIVQSTLSDWENDKMRPRHARLEKIALALGVTVRRLIA